MSKLDSESSTDKFISNQAIFDKIKNGKFNDFSTNDITSFDEKISTTNLRNEKNNDKDKLTASTSSHSNSELYSDSLENIPQTLEQPTATSQSKDAILINRTNNSNDALSNRNRNRNTSESSSTSSTSSGVGIYEVENAMINNNLIDTNKVNENYANYNRTELEDLSEKREKEEYSKKEQDSKDFFVESHLLKTQSSLMKRTILKDLIHDLYDINTLKSKIEAKSCTEKSNSASSILLEGFMEKLPPGKNLKNSILLAWKRRYFRLSSIGVLTVYDNQVTDSFKEDPVEMYNLMGGRVEYEQNRVISLDDCRGNYIVCRCCPNDSNGDEDFIRWKTAIDSQIVDRSDSLWVRPNQSLIDDKHNSYHMNEKKVLIIDIGTCSLRAGTYNNIPQLPQLFVPTVCSRNQNLKLNVGFDALDYLLNSTAPSTIDLHKSISMLSLGSNMNQNGGQLIFPLRTKSNIDKLNMDIESIEAIFDYVVESLDINCPDYQILVITTHKLSDKVNYQFLNLLLEKEKFRFDSAVIINQTLLTLYAYNSNVGIVANLGKLLIKFFKEFSNLIFIFYDCLF
jgi:hypothetical protein